MASAADLALQQAVFGVLDGDGVLTGLTTGVFDHVPGDAALPYVVIGEATAVDWSSKSFDGQRHSLTLHVWSAALGGAEAKTILDRLYTLLHRAELTLAGHALVLLRFEFSQTLRDVDDRTYHGVIRFGALTRSVG